MDDAYVAGLFDGEGFVRVNVWRDPNGPHIRYQVIAGIGMTYRPVIEMLHAAYGGALYETRHDKRNPNNRIQFSWQISSQKAARFLERIQPHLIVKKDQVELALKLQHHIDRYKLRGGNWHSPNPERVRLREERQAIADEMRRLKKVSFPSRIDSGPSGSMNGH